MHMAHRPSGKRLRHPVNQRGWWLRWLGLYCKILCKVSGIVRAAGRRASKVVDG